MFSTIMDIVPLSKNIQTSIFDEFLALMSSSTVYE